MEIYSLGEEIPEKRSASRITGKGRDVSGDVGEVGERSAYKIAENRGGASMVITDLKQGVKNPNRVNVFVGGKYVFSLDVAQVVDLKIKVGMVLTSAKLAEYRKASEYGKAYQRALEWVLMRPRSRQELREYLRRSKYKAEMKERQKEWQEDNSDKWRMKKRRDERETEWGARMRRDEREAERREKNDFSDLIYQRLNERGYVDDKKFAEYYVENRFVKKGVSRRRLEMELRQKGIEENIIREVLEGRDETEEIKKMIAKKRGKYDDEKLISYLVRQGFSYQLVQSLVRECGKD